MVCFSSAFATDYDDAWDALTKKNFKQAEISLQKAKQNPATAMDAYLTQVFLQTYQGNETLLNEEFKKFFTDIVETESKYIVFKWSENFFTKKIIHK